MSSKKLQAIALVGISVLVIVSTFVAISFTNSSVLAKSNQSGGTVNRTTRKPVIIIKGSTDVTKVAVYDHECKIIGTLEINTIVALMMRDGSYETASCEKPNEGMTIPVYRLFDKVKNQTEKNQTGYIFGAHFYVLDTTSISEIFTNYQAIVANKKPFFVEENTCKPQKTRDLYNSKIVLSNPVKTKKCTSTSKDEYEMVKIQFTNNRNKTVTGYIALEHLKPVEEFNTNR